MPARISALTGRSSFICAQCRKALTAPKRRRLLSTSPKTPEIYDVVTVGGGPAGLALLAALKSSPVTSHLKTALIEIQDLTKPRQWSSPGDQFSNRASSFTPSSVSFLETTGSWAHVDQTRIQAYDEMQVWDAANDASIQFDWNAETQKYNAPPQTIATMCENANLTRGLLERIVELGAGSSLFSSTSVSSIENGVDDPEGLNLSTWPVLSLESQSQPHSQSQSAGQPPSDTPNPTPTNIAARLLVGADGFNSPVRAFAGINSSGWDYNRHGVVATLTLQPADSNTATDRTHDFDLFSSEPLPNRATAYQRFLPQLGGPIAILPLPHDRASMVWSTTPANAAYLKSLPPSAQVAMINAALRLSQTDLKYLLSLPAHSHSDSAKTDTDADTDANVQHETELRWRLEHTDSAPADLTRQQPPPFVTGIQENSLASFPLRFRHATSLINPRVALIGDAAHTIHPLAGQGLNLGLADAKSLAECIAYSVSHGMDVGDAMALERYSSARFGRGLMMAGGVDVLNSLYQLGSGGDGMLASVVGQARGLGMKVVNQLVPGLKGLIMRQAS
ncbi:putative ubiquinone biosynthesis monooxygenase [Exophiala xenobiotica]|uniref:Ubiquinone biosynthesis monooxygenase COQ6, mitochondrial n=1 Tax=Vermiconidia calcicola TaxID=1690605 RepID=A0AAV9QPD6_9PEZI|nr:putative ubiquinone biosynthesis monooxygenase [Exophiala xenobiotica]KAK5545934.1 putative ubiquinone biosynthesis monooxygenase [Vermiconidia calcicola]KAK5549807.1 putative ubiquinone biosynthesis monooxygenase [Chaetothyriales sp. CCFEE 6169]KAK5199330.1 putative ubiquinone biosynthesis monooxygenase [Exophiala xenobiotica]KAK5229686.1 putative ubiquinone biosynthesis monooxygenase [Exophiala xenobiotica]